MMIVKKSRHMKEVKHYRGFQQIIIIPVIGQKVPLLVSRFYDFDSIKVKI